MIGYGHYTMASADSEFYDLSDADIDSYNDDAIPENTKKTTARGISFWKVRLRIISFSFGLVEVFLPVVNSPKNWKFTDRSE